MELVTVRVKLYATTGWLPGLVSILDCCVTAEVRKRSVLVTQLVPPGCRSRRFWRALKLAVLLELQLPPDVIVTVDKEVMKEAL